MTTNQDKTNIHLSNTTEEQLEAQRPRQPKAQKTAHSLGLWHRVTTSEGDCVAITADNGRVCTLNQMNKSTNANARLIAAAPDLLAATQEFIRVMENPKTTTAMPHTVAKARAAIAKAEGRAQ